MDNTNPTKSLISRKICQVEGCSTVATQGKICGKHYYRLKRHGSFDISLLPRTTPETFWAQVDKTPGLGPKGECWEWRGCIDKACGYGSVGFQGETYRMHRLAWFFVYGEHPTQNVLHSCDNKICCNPDHLREGTAADNIKDMVVRGRQKTKLSWSDVVEMRRLWANGSGLREVARQFNIRHSTAAKIRDGIMWRYMPESDDLARCQSELPDAWAALVGRQG